jgi:pyruvyl transferase EpsI
MTNRQKLFLKYLLSSNTKSFVRIQKNKPKIIVALAADYGNLGDVAITYAQTKFIKSQFPNYEIIDFPISRTFQEMKNLKKICTKQDIITIVGGGNTGDMYDDIEYCRQFFIQQFPDNTIISFPQTIDFSNSISGQRALEKAINVYSNHKKLILCAREEVSYKKYQKYFPNNKVFFLPDIVLSLNEELPRFKREGLTLSLRSDGEKRMDMSEQKLLEEKLKQKYNIKYYDTHINKNNLSIEEREYELSNIWAYFKKSKVVVTDRLHGMIFCAITKTPCIAIDNSNRKVSGVYDAWLSNLGYIKMIKEYDYEEIQSLIEHLWNYDIDNQPVVNLYEKFLVLAKYN